MKRIVITLMVAASWMFSAGFTTASADPKETVKEAHEHGSGEHDSAESSPATGGPEDHDDSEGEESAKIGPGKGIEAFDEHTGMKLSQQAMRSFEIEVAQLNGAGPWTLPSSAKVHSGEEVNVYRVRDGFFKRIDFKEIKKDQRTFTLSSPDLKTGDSVATKGLGFLRIAEIAASGGAPEGHSH
jgi:hypothetical protein